MAGNATVDYSILGAGSNGVFSTDADDAMPLFANLIGLRDGLAQAKILQNEILEGFVADREQVMS